MSCACGRACVIYILVHMQGVNIRDVPIILGKNIILKPFSICSDFEFNHCKHISKLLIATKAMFPKCVTTSTKITKIDTDTIDSNVSWCM